MTDYADFDLDCGHYKEFLDKYASSHNYNGKNYTHSIPSSFVYRLVRDNSIWMLSLIMGVAGYSMYFDDDTESSRVITKEMLDNAGVKDPVLSYKSTLTPWTGVTSTGKRPDDPVSRVTTGVGICHFNRGGLEDFYHAGPVSAELPEADSGKNIVREEGVLKTKKYTISYEGKPVYGWGMGYGSKRLSLSCITNDTKGLSYIGGSEGKTALKGRLNDKTVKLIGPDYGASYGSTSYMSKAEASDFREWCSAHFSDRRDCLYPPLLWMAKYWAPFFCWHDGTKENSIQTVMIASSVYNSGGLSVSSMQGKSPDDIIQRYLNLGSKPSEKEHFQRRIVNTQRAIALVEFIKRV